MADSVDDNAWFGILLIATVAAASWYTRQPTTNRKLKMVTYFVAGVGVVTVAFFLAVFLTRR